AVVLVVGSPSTYFIVRSQLRGQIDSDLRERTVAATSEFTVRAKLQTTSPTSPAGPAPEGLGRVQVTSSGSFGSAPIFALVIGGNALPPPPLRGGVTLPVSQRALEVARTHRGAYYSDVDVRGSHLRMYVTPVGNGYAVIVARSLA